jgi:hypothetical protein
MTAEIAVMNQEAVALAADSAVTGSAKIFQSANKIFALSKYRPVALMIYDNAQFLGVPWETIVKLYRRQLGDTCFPTLQEHADDFLQFLNSSPALFPPAAEKQAAGMLAYSIGTTIMDKALTAIDSRLGNAQEVTEQEVTEEVEIFINLYAEEWKAAKRRKGLPTKYRETVLRRYRDIAYPAIEAAFKQIKLSSRAKRQLKSLFADVTVKDLYFEGAATHSGIVIAGFGSDDIFPRLRRFQVSGVLADNLICTEDEPVDIGILPGERAYIAPFAQREQVNTFMEGIDPDLQMYVHGWWLEKLDGLVGEVADHLKLDDAERQRLTDAFDPRCTEIAHQEFGQALHSFSDANNVQPVINIVGMLPKDVLAEMAESLVNLTSFKRRMTPQAETVGGPIDVAVISRGDGFIWIKRKHYFKTELNPHFLANYYRG